MFNEFSVRFNTDPRSSRDSHATLIFGNLFLDRERFDQQVIAEFVIRRIKL